jgi:hypothetical protein
MTARSQPPVLPAGDSEGYVGQIKLPKGLEGGGFVTIYDGTRRGREIYVEPRYLKVLLVYNKIYMKDGERGAKGESRGWVSYKRLAKILAKRSPDTLTPDESSLPAYASELNKLLLKAAPAGTSSPLLWKRDLGRRLCGPFRVMDQTELDED